MNQPPESSEPSVFTKITNEQGRWVVYLNVSRWDPISKDDTADPIESCWYRINDFSTKTEAEVAAKWYHRGADKKIRRPRGY